jgi:hypothetical protein
LRDFSRRLHQQPRELGKIGDAGEDVHEYDADARPRCNPAHHGNEPRRVAAELARADIAEVQRPVPFSLQLVDELHAQPRAGGDEPDLTVGIDLDIVEPVRELAFVFRINVGVPLKQRADRRLADDRVVVDYQFDIAGDEAAIRKDEQRIDLEQSRLVAEEDVGQARSRVGQCFA